MKEIGKKAINYIVSGLIMLGFIFMIEFTYYSLAPICWFIDYEKIELHDQKQGEPIQLMYSYRNSSKTLEGDYLFKTYCFDEDKQEWITDSDWFYHLNPVLLEKTNGLETIKVDMHFPYELPKGKCKTLINVKLNVGGVTRELENFETYFNIY